MSHGCEVHAGPHETCTRASALVLVYMSVYAKGSSFFLLLIYLLSFIFPLPLLFCFFVNFWLRCQWGSSDCCGGCAGRH